LPGFEDAAAQCVAHWNSLGVTRRPRVHWFPRPIVPYSSLLGPVFELTDSSDVDAILFADERRHSPLHILREVVGTLQAPIIDLNGRAGDFADVHFDLMNRQTWDQTARCIQEFSERRWKLDLAFRATVEPDMQLLAHAFVSGRRIMATRYPMASEAVCYPGYWTAERTIAAAEKLVRRGLLTKSFFDRIHECQHCKSRRLTVREECPKCRSAELTDVDLIHHYHCASLLPEEKFRQGRALVCPKCHQHLRNYGKDYDKPGRAQLCQQCEETTSEPSVGFVCLDCDASTDGDAIKRIDLFSYALTAQAESLLTQPQRPQLVPGLPVSLMEELERLGRHQQGGMMIAEVKYGARDAIVDAKGEAMFDRLRRLFLENMANYLSEAGSLHPGDIADYVLLASTDDKLAAELDRLIARSDATLSQRLEPQVRLAVRSAQASR